MTGETCTLYQRWTANKSYHPPPPPKKTQQAFMDPSRRFLDRSDTSETHMGSHVHTPAALPCLWTASKHPLRSKRAFKLFQGTENPLCMSAPLITHRQQIHHSQMFGSVPSTREFGVEVLGSSYGVFEVINSVKVLSHLICCIGAFKWTSSSFTVTINMR